jgi:hypothetical protein
MNKKLLILILIPLILVLTFLLLDIFLLKKYFCPVTESSQITIEEEQIPKAMMILIEFKEIDGLVNMVNDMVQRDIKGLMMLTPDFVEENTIQIQELLDTGNVEIVATYVEEPLWGMPYEQQYEILNDTIERIEAVVDTKIRIISSRYMASDETTVQVAEELGIEYITARGTTDLAAFVYKPEEYDVKIISVSNIDTIEFKYGSLCDYSYFERAGSPDDMIKDLVRATKQDKFFGVSHTYIGGYKARWNDMWHEFWDNNEIEWIDLDTLGQVDKEMPMWQIPVNQNSPYTPERMRPEIPYEEEENVFNMCGTIEWER